ncbi:FtsK/SpoIIIE domain-containing protein [Lentzea sp. NBRC 102530]|uniref:FtsK/SpoIIIE domain-containing protein n=1 Tax=Lentzea sp. NBRC 102530 TaxID=3032201 RepID=UPI0024A36A38|nr:FtsK/SpoIIIE domain-containing protein [Lentzea sp. NBRC 102530]GLY54830.1 hypothetical protein Lesp01_84850 [Lentzea sp. NBRC 102530]
MTRATRSGPAAAPPPNNGGQFESHQQTARHQSVMGRARRLLTMLAGLGTLLAWGLPLLEGMLGSSTMPALRTAFTAAAGFGKVLEPWAIGLLVAALLAQVVALWAWRQRRRLVDQVAQLLKIKVIRGAATVRVGLRAPRGGTVPVPTGYVATTEQLHEAAKALTRKWGKPYEITHDERRDRLRVRRVKRDPTIEEIEPESYIDAVHERLAQVRDELPLSVTDIKAWRHTYEDGTPDRCVYEIHYTATPNATVESWQQRVGNAILALVGEPDGRQLEITWLVQSDVVRLTEKEHYADEVHERLDATKDAWPIRVISMDPVPETMFDGTPTTSFKVKYQPSSDSTKAAWQRVAGEAIAGLVGETPSGTRLVSSWEPSRDTMWLREVPVLPRFLNHPVIEDYSDFLKESPGQILLPFGLTDLGTPAVWNVSPSCGTPHALLAGGTGKGKTSTERTLIVSGLRRNIPMFLIDPKTFELIEYVDTPGVFTVASTPDHVAGFIECLDKETVTRERAIARNQLDKNNVNEVPLFCIVIDEFMVLSALLTQWTREQNAGLSNFDGGRTRNPIELLKLLIVRIRAIGGRILIVTQRPDAKQWGDGAARDSLSMRLAMSRMSREGDDMMFDGAGSTQHLDESIPGRGMAKMLTGDVHEAQVWWTPSMEQRQKSRDKMSPADRALADSLRPNWKFDHGLFVPANEAEPLLRRPDVLEGQAPPSNSHYSAIINAADTRYVRELRPGMPIIVDVDGELVPALLINIEEDGPTWDLEVRVEGERTNRIIGYDRDDTVAIPAQDPE